MTADATNSASGGMPSAAPIPPRIPGSMKAMTSTEQTPVTSQILENANVRSRAHLRARIEPIPSQMNPAAVAA